MQIFWQPWRRVVCEGLCHRSTCEQFASYGPFVWMCVGVKKGQRNGSFFVADCSDETVKKCGRSDVYTWVAVCLDQQK